MIYFRGTKDIHLDHTVVALGKFDGLHRMKVKGKDNGLKPLFAIFF